MLANLIIQTGLQFLGTPYVFNSPSGQAATFDCSSFMQYIFQQHGIILPRSSRQQFQAGIPVSDEAIQKGDLLFFTIPSRREREGAAKVGHVALYIGEGCMLHTTRHAGEVLISSLNRSWKSRYVGARRFIE